MLPLLLAPAPRQRFWRGRPRLILAMSLTALLSGAAVPAHSQDGPMASAPLPPPLRRPRRRRQPDCNSRPENEARPRNACESPFHRRQAVSRPEIRTTITTTCIKTTILRSPLIKTSRSAYSRRARASGNTYRSTGCKRFNPATRTGAFSLQIVRGAPPVYGYAPVYIHLPWPPVDITAKERSRCLGRQAAVFIRAIRRAGAHLRRRRRCDHRWSRDGMHKRERSAEDRNRTQQSVVCLCRTVS